MAPVVKLLPQPPEPKPVAPPVADLDAFGQALVQQLGTSPAPYRLNAAMLNFSLRFHQLHCVTRKRDVHALIDVYLRHGSKLYDLWLALSRVELSKPPKPAAGLPPVAAPPKPATLAEAVAELYRSI